MDLLKSKNTEYMSRLQVKYKSNTGVLEEYII